MSGITSFAMSTPITGSTTINNVSSAIAALSHQAPLAFHTPHLEIIQSTAELCALTSTKLSPGTLATLKSINSNSLHEAQAELGRIGFSLENQPTAFVLGQSISGLIWAGALATCGYKVTIADRVNMEEPRAKYCLRLDNAGLNALEYILPGVHQDIKARCQQLNQKQFIFSQNFQDPAQACQTTRELIIYSDQLHQVIRERIKSSPGNHNVQFIQGNISILNVKDRLHIFNNPQNMKSFSQHKQELYQAEPPNIFINAEGKHGTTASALKIEKIGLTETQYWCAGVTKDTKAINPESLKNMILNTQTNEVSGYILHGAIHNAAYDIAPANESGATIVYSKILSKKGKAKVHHVATSEIQETLRSTLIQGYQQPNIDLTHLTFLNTSGESNSTPSVFKTNATIARQAACQIGNTLMLLTGDVLASNTFEAGLGLNITLCQAAQAFSLSKQLQTSKAIESRVVESINTKMLQYADQFIMACDNYNNMNISLDDLESWHKGGNKPEGSSKIMESFSKRQLQRFTETAYNSFQKKKFTALR